ncbi:hypothetical protein QSJ19_09395 [Gordonia sp. ABSL11-1]|uniref:hypothetical protein n=1 Tax=Gordonia sp. ABSL11-1 TaxID=3053924 RepID=UPI0025733E9A|nr:hypothetical protein [Gordonia sp. ABSL11-1]MDL9945799.1 hypothetical protein [Gordonia sp. ABSL11-1]
MSTGSYGGNAYPYVVFHHYFDLQSALEQIVEREGRPGDGQRREEPQCRQIDLRQR